MPTNDLYPTSYRGTIAGTCTPKDDAKIRNQFVAIDDALMKSLGIASINEQMERRNVLVAISGRDHFIFRPGSLDKVPEKIAKDYSMVATIAGAASAKKSDEAIRVTVQRAFRSVIGDKDMKCVIASRASNPPSAILPSGEYIEVACNDNYKLFGWSDFNGIHDANFRRPSSFGDGITVSFHPYGVNTFGSARNDIDQHAERVAKACK